MRTRTKLERMFTEFARRLFAVLQPLQKTILMNIADTPFTQAGIEQRLLGCRLAPTYTTQILFLLFFLQKMFFCSWEERVSNIVAVSFSLSPTFNPFSFLHREAGLFFGCFVLFRLSQKQCRQEERLDSRAVAFSIFPDFGTAVMERQFHVGYGTRIDFTVLQR